MTEEQLTLFFRFLDKLREDGSTNMLAGARALAARHSLSKPDAVKVHGMWMDTFDGTSSATDRAATAIRCST